MFDDNGREVRRSTRLSTIKSKEMIDEKRNGLKEEKHHHISDKLKKKSHKRRHRNKKHKRSPKLATDENKSVDLDNNIKRKSRAKLSTTFFIETDKVIFPTGSSDEKKSLSFQSDNSFKSFVTEESSKYESFTAQNDHQTITDYNLFTPSKDVFQSSPIKDAKKVEEIPDANPLQETYDVINVKDEPDATYDMNNEEAMNTTFQLNILEDTLTDVKEDSDNHELTLSSNKTKKRKRNLDETFEIPSPKEKKIKFDLNPIICSETKNLSPKYKPNSVKKVSKVKMPNFALIHQKAYDKMENLVQHNERKAKRAEFLLSGSKMKLPTKTPDRSADSKAKKQLRFTLSTPQNESRKSIPTPFTPKNSNISKISDIKNRKPTPMIVKRSNGKENALISNQTKLSFGKEKLESKLKIKKKEDLKKIINKTKPVANNVDKHRTTIKGVRMNRRFELLMNMRNKK